MAVSSTILASRLGPYIRRNRKTFTQLFTCGILVNLFGLTLPIFSSFVYDKVLGNGITSTMWALAIAIGLVIIIEWSVRMIRIVLAERFSTANERSIDAHIIQGMLATQLNALPPIGRLIEKYKQLLYYRDFLSSNYILALADLPFLCLFLLAILLAAGPLVLVGIVYGTLMLLVHAFLMPVAMEHEMRGKRSGEKRLELMAEMLAAREAIIGNAMQQSIQGEWTVASARATIASSRARLWRGVAQSIGNSLTYLSFVSVLIGGVYMVENQMLTSGGLLAASMLTSRVMSSFGSVATLALRYQEFKRALKEINKALPAAEGEGAVHAAERGKLLGQVDFFHVTCHLRDGLPPVLRDVSLTIMPGEMIGIAGAPGAGKTTLLRLLCGLITPTEGQVLLDQCPLASLSPRDLSVSMGYKPQEPSLLDGTIEENILAGRASLSATERMELLESSGLGRCFSDQGLNWATPVGPRGMQLSGGQRQLVALARALLGFPSILLLDEPTTGLDAPLEKHIAKQILKRKGTATILISSHSRALLELCDRIIVVGDGKILANGTRDKVLM